MARGTLFPRKSRLCHRMAKAPLHHFLFADISGYSRLSELGGDEVAADVALRFASVAEAIAPEHGARVVKRVGDAVMLHADNASDLIALGLRLHEELGSLPRSTSGSIPVAPSSGPATGGGARSTSPRGSRTRPARANCSSPKRPGGRPDTGAPRRCVGSEPCSSRTSASRSRSTRPCRGWSCR